LNPANNRTPGALALGVCQKAHPEAAKRLKAFNEKNREELKKKKISK
jgi:hypothetical protein